ncbi:hypothetical protein FIBSPDRAFT_1040967 [Athelia psychrophila]|uniref:Heme haloperoxidase family profile domain-containing protein n=1 Tax=Athelia psychrophila TaxID=1759441 RepID=A0A166PJJ3_9AGAM|nr:hypothetical protein FIBSPDRAFT_1040967 [Fibularhizoctonia sp. CBS 109695]
MTAAHRARPPPRDVPCPPAAQVYCFPPQTGDVRSLLPTLDMVTDHGHLPPHSNMTISLSTFARTLQAGYDLPPILAWFLSLASFILLFPSPLSLAIIVRHNRIEHDANLVHQDRTTRQVPSTTP